MAVRLPGDATRLRAGDCSDVKARRDEVVMRRAEPTADLTELFRGQTAEAWRAEYAQAYDWGPDVGREVIHE